MGMMNNKARTPPVGCVGLADLARHVEPRIETEPVAAKTGRHQDSGDAGVEKLLNRF